ncbi:putative nucleotide-diphospho-sugar transferase [Arabidopsis thaliana]
MDDKAYSRCLEVFPRRCFFLRTTGVDFSSETQFMAADYLKMMWRRTEFLGSLLKLGYNQILGSLAFDCESDNHCKIFANGYL